MAGAGKRQRLALRLASIPMGLLAISCLYPMFFAVNNALKTRHDYLLDRFGLATQPTLDNFAQAWTGSHLDQYFLNSVIATVGAVRMRGVDGFFRFAAAALWWFTMTAMAPKPYLYLPVLMVTSFAVLSARAEA